jgi:hypothetical protein
MELGIRLRFAKTSELRGGEGIEHPNPALGTPLTLTIIVNLKKVTFIECPFILFSNLKLCECRKSHFFI